MNAAGDPRGVIQSIQHALASAPAFRSLAPGARRDMTAALNDIAGVLGADPVDLAAAALADGPGGLAGSGGGGLGSGGTTSGGGGPTGRVGEVARATLNAIDFPSFVAALIKGTFQAIVDATIEQMEAYATLLKEVAKTVDDYMEDNVTEGAAQDYLADRYGDVFVKKTTGGDPTLEVDRSNPTQPLPSFFSNLGFDNPAQIDPVSVEEVIVPAARKTIAEQRHQTLATMVLLGLNRIVIDDGEINAKLMFHIDASETMSIAFDSTQQTMGNLAGVSGGTSFTGNGIMVNTTNVNAQSDINVRADLTGEVRVRFSSDVLPLERFADSNAIQLINQHATVPSTPQPAAANGADNGGDGADAEQQSYAPPVPALGTRGRPRPVEPATMSWPELHATLTDLVGAFDPAGGSGLVVDHAEVAVPLEVRTAVGPAGLVFYARAPHSRWRTGVLPQIQTGRLAIERTDDVGRVEP